MAVILVGGQLGEFKIQQKEFLDVVSQGMICSAAELGLAEELMGVMKLPDDTPVGVPGALESIPSRRWINQPLRDRATTEIIACRRV